MFKSYEDAVEFIKKTHQKYKLKIKAPYSIEFSNRMRSCLGRCREFRLCGKPMRYTFTYNNKYIKANLNNGNKIQDTVLHEIAHAIVGSEHHHDRVWRDCAQRIGCSGSRLATGINQYQKKGRNQVSNAQQVAIYLRGIKNLRLNTLYEYCHKQGLSASEIEFVKWYINQR